MTKIEWTNESWNPVVGCTKVSEGCQNCYAERMACRLASMGQIKYRRVTGALRGCWNDEIECDESALEIPLRWKKPRRIFVCSMGDLFLAPFEFIDKVMGTIILSKAQTSRRYSSKFHYFQLLTKHPEVMLKYYKSSPWPRISKYLDKRYGWNWGAGREWYPENIWLGVTLELQKYEQRVVDLLQIPAAVRFVSAEPLLGEIDLSRFLAWWRCDKCGGYSNHKETYKGDNGKNYALNPFCSCRDMPMMGGKKGFFHPRNKWLIIGCESLQGRAGRFQDGFNDAAVNLVEQCDEASVPVFIKQVPHKGKVLKRNPDGTYPEGWIKELQVQEYPKAAKLEGLL